MSESAGGTFRLVCGQIGAGKSYLYVKQVEEEVKKSGKYKKIYSNIRAHAELAEGITPLPDDWRECEPDSLVIIDEVQKHEKFSKHFSSRRDSEIVDLTMIRHQRLDLWLISPNPALVNSDVRNLVTQYFWLEVVGAKTTKCYCFTKVYNSITKSIKQQAYDEFVYTIEEKYHKLYKSTEDGIASGRNYNFNVKLWGFIGGLVFVVIIACLLVAFLAKGTKTKVDQMSTAQKSDAAQAQKTKEESKDKLGVMSKLTDEECRKGVNVDKPECVEYFNRLTKNGESVGPAVQQVSYDPSKPFESADKIQETVTYQVTAKPVLSGCMTDRHGKLVGYTQQGTIVHDLNQSDCKRIIKGDRPFNYFAQQSVSQAVQQPIQQVAPSQTYQAPVQANNYVQEGLQRNPVNGANQL